MALAARSNKSGDLCGKSARRGCRVASGNKGKSVVIQLFPRDETGMGCWEGGQRKTTLRASLYFWPSHPRGAGGAEGPSGLMRPFA